MLLLPALQSRRTTCMPPHSTLPANASKVCCWQLALASVTLQSLFCRAEPLSIEGFLSLLHSASTVGPARLRFERSAPVADASGDPAPFNSLSLDGSSVDGDPAARRSASMVALLRLLDGTQSQSATADSQGQSMVARSAEQRSGGSALSL